MDTYIVATVTTNKRPDDPPAITMFALQATSEQSATKAVNQHVVAPQWAIEARSLKDGTANVLGLKNGEVRQL